MAAPCPAVVEAVVGIVLDFHVVGHMAGHSWERRDSYFA